MLARVTYGLVIVAVGTLIGGFFTEESNVLLFVSIGLSVAAIVLVLVGWARRAKEAPATFEAEGAEEEEEALLEALDEEELAFVEERRPRRASRPKRPAARSKAKPKPKAKPRTSSGTGRRASKASAKPRPARKSKPASARKGTARPKRKPPRRPPGSR